MDGRNPYLISKVLKSFLWASVLAAVSTQLATTTDAIVVGNLIGPDAISGINVDMPVITLFTCVMILFGIGASVAAAKAIGSRDQQRADGIFTSCLISSTGVCIVLALFIFIFSEEIVELLTGGNAGISSYGVIYLRVMCLAMPFMMIASILEYFVRTDGNPRTVMTGVIAGSIVNLVLDIVFIKFCNTGIAGSAYATGINYIVTILVCLSHFGSKNSSLRWRLDLKYFFNYVGLSVQQGFAMAINTFLLSVSIMALNAIVLFSRGSEGMYCWSVCLQVFMIMQMVLSGIGSSIFSLGGILVGEGDMKGLSILNLKTILYTVIAMGAVTAFLLSAPGEFGRLFGSGFTDDGGTLSAALRIYSLMLIPYSILAELRSNYQIIGRYSLSLWLSVAQLFIMVLFVWGFSFLSGNAIWWGFPASSICLFVGVLIYSTVTVSRHRGELQILTLIPKNESVPALNVSVKITDSDIESSLSKIVDFLKENSVGEGTIFDVRLACEELLNNILQHAVKRNAEKHYIDVHLRCESSTINVLIKDDGKAFDPTLPLEEDDEPGKRIGLRLVNGLGVKMSYRFMYDQNTVQLIFPRN